MAGEYAEDGFVVDTFHEEFQVRQKEKCSRLETVIKEYQMIVEKNDEVANELSDAERTFNSLSLDVGLTQKIMKKTGEDMERLEMQSVVMQQKIMDQVIQTIKRQEEYISQVCEYDLQMQHLKNKFLEAKDNYTEESVMKAIVELDPQISKKTAEIGDPNKTLTEELGSSEEHSEDFTLLLEEMNQTLKMVEEDATLVHERVRSLEEKLAASTATE